MTNDEIVRTHVPNSGKQVCGRDSSEQEMRFSAFTSPVIYIN